MTLREILRKGVYHSIFNGLYKYYYHKESEEDLVQLSVTYRKVRDRLLDLPKNKNGGKILITGGSPLPNDIEEVLLQEENGDIYAPDLCPWEDLIDREVVSEEPYAGSMAEIAAHILWEITFYGYSPDDIAARISSLESQTTEAIKNYNDDPTL